jgi:hypothetical protein
LSRGKRAEEGRSERRSRGTERGAVGDLGREGEMGRGHGAVRERRKEERGAVWGRRNT